MSSETIGLDVIVAIGEGAGSSFYHNNMGAISIETTLTIRGTPD